MAAALVPAHTLLDIDQFGLPQHVESPDTTDCPVHQGYIFCQIVRSPAAPGAAQRVTIAAEDAPIHVAHPGHESCVPISASIWSASLIPRAPPLG